MLEKLKSWLANDTYFTVFLLLLVGLSSFALGRLSSLETVSLETSQASLQALPGLVSEVNGDQVSLDGVVVVASRSGTKYHLLNCPGAGQIKTENRIEFTSIDAARAAGYTAATNCPGLE